MTEAEARPRVARATLLLTPRATLLLGARALLLLAPIVAMALGGCAGKACQGRLSMEELTRSPCWEEGVSLWVRTVEGKTIRGRVEDLTVGADSALVLVRESDFSVERVPLESVEYAEVIGSSPAVGVLLAIVVGGLLLVALSYPGIPD